MKSWTLRGTVHVFAEADLPVFLRRETYLSRGWAFPDFWNSRPDWALTPERQDHFLDVILSALSAGPLGREALRDICRSAGMTGDEEASLFHPWGGGLRQLCERGFIIYEATEGKTFRLCPAIEPLSRPEAELELARRYFTHLGPATLRDAAYFFGVPQRTVRAWLDKLSVETAQCGGRTVFYMENGAVELSSPPRCLLLAGFDQLILAYDKRENPFLRPEDLRGVFGTAGIVYPVVLLGGEAAGRWKLTGKKLTVQPFRTLTGDERDSIREAAQRLWGRGTELNIT